MLPSGLLAADLAYVGMSRNILSNLILQLFIVCSYGCHLLNLKKEQPDHEVYVYPGFQYRKSR